MDPETFFPAPSEPADAALALCRTCDVQGSCLAWALDAGDCHGVWGATTARERRAMLVAWRADTNRELLPLLPTPRIRTAVGDDDRAVDLVPADLVPAELVPVDLVPVAAN